MFVTCGDLPAAQNMIGVIDMIHMMYMINVINVNENLIIAFGPVVPEPVEGRSKACPVTCLHCCGGQRRNQAGINRIGGD